MNYTLNETHDPKLTSWVETANAPSSHFPIQNLPYGVFKPKGSAEAPRVGVAIGNQILDITACLSRGLLDGMAAESCAAPSLNALMALGQQHWTTLRRQLSKLLRVDAHEYHKDPELGKHLLIPIDEVELLLPAVIGDYTDFYASAFHATNVGSMFRPDNPLLPNYKHVPIGYHGRASSVIISGTPVRRPNGQTKDDQASGPNFAPSKQLDYECEVGFFVGPGNSLGASIPIDDGAAHIFGFCLVNDWSARDIQRWEYQPLGPFLAKSFATSISPWIVTSEALAPFRCPAFARPEGDPAPLPYLTSQADQEAGGVEIKLEMLLSTEEMRKRGDGPQLLSTGNLADMYWTVAQMLTHHASNGCNLRPGDLLASGTVSGAAKESRGSLLELTWRGTEPIQLPTGEVRRFLEDGDEVIMRGSCQRAPFAAIGFGECRGTILPAVQVA